VPPCAAMTPASYDVVVAGAGPVGLTLGGLLARRGLRCAVVDRAAARTDKSKALVVWPRTLELLAAAGMEEAFLAAGSKARGGRLFGRGRQLAWLDFSRSGAAYPFSLMIPQSETERLLEAEAQAAGVALQRETEVLRFAAAADGVDVALRGGDGGERVVRCGWLVGCDGAHSAVRHGLGLAFAGSAEDNDWFLADVHIDGALPRDEVSLFLHPDGVLACFPIPPNRFRVLGDLGAAHGEHPRDPTLADVQALLARRGPGALTVRDPVWLAGFRINERQVPSYRRGRVLLAGDAAHIHSPAGGQGMNTGMHDAFNLAWKLALVHQGRARADLIDTYDAERHPIGALVVRGAGGLTRLATIHSAAGQRLRDAVVSRAYSVRRLSDLVVGVLTEVAIHYRGSRLSRDERSALTRLRARRGGVRAGERAPDAAVSDAAGGATSLFALLRGGRHVLLLSAGVPAGLAAAVQRAYPDLVDCAVLRDPSPPYGACTATAILVRPDGYIGYLGAPAAAPRLVAHLGTYLIPSP